MTPGDGCASRAEWLIRCTPRVWSVISPLHHYRNSVLTRTVLTFDARATMLVLGGFGKYDYTTTDGCIYLLFLQSVFFRPMTRDPFSLQHARTVYSHRNRCGFFFFGGVRLFGVVCS